jgi:hypothetical protein
MSFYFSLDFVKVGLASDREDRAAEPVVASRRCGDVAYIAIVCHNGSPSASFVAALNAMLDGVGRRGFGTTVALLRATIAEAGAEAVPFCLVRIDDRARIVRFAARDFAVWVRSGAVLSPLGPGAAPYRPGDAFLIVDPSADALLRGSHGVSRPVIGRSNRAGTIARELLDALLATAPPGTTGLESVIALRVIARDGVVFRKRIAAAVAISAAVHFLITGGFGLFHSPGLTARERERREAATVVTISSAPHKATRAVQRPPAPQRAASKSSPQQPPVQPAQPAQPAQPVTPQRAAIAKPPPASLVVPPKMRNVPPRHVAFAPVGPKESHETQPAHASQQTVTHYSAAQLAALQSRLAAATEAVNHVDPLAVPSSEPAAPKRYALDMVGDSSALRHQQGILRPIRSWQHDGYTYYYVSYEIVFPDGSTEAGDVPWPIRYLPAEDPFTQPPHTIPLPPPLPDFVLPAGTHLGRALRPYFPNLTSAN